MDEETFRKIFKEELDCILIGTKGIANKLDEVLVKVKDLQKKDTERYNEINEVVHKWMFTTCYTS